MSEIRENIARLVIGQPQTKMMFPKPLVKEADFRITDPVDKPERNDDISMGADDVPEDFGNFDDDSTVRFSEIMEEIKTLTREAMELISDHHEQQRAKSYWYAHIMGNVDEEEYPGASMLTMAETLGAMKETL